MHQSPSPERLAWLQKLAIPDSVGLRTRGFSWRSLSWLCERVQAKGRECKQREGVVSAASAALAGFTSVSAVAISGAPRPCCTHLPMLNQAGLS